MSLKDKVIFLTEYIESLSDFEIIPPDIPYHHMGATITDAMLQAGVKWETVVKPRVERLKNDYPQARTTTGFLKVLESKGAKRILAWDHPEKPNRVLDVTRFFAEKRIENENDLRIWLENDINVARLKNIGGIGDKTTNYLKMLTGISTTAVDRHMIDFLNLARIDIDIGIYSEAKEIIDETADRMGIEGFILDNSIWMYMSTKKGVRPCA